MERRVERNPQALSGNGPGRRQAPVGDGPNRRDAREAA
jgi:hypothetical protein